VPSRAEPGPDVAYLVPHGAIRQCVLGGDDRRADAAALSAMQDLLRESLAEGACGLSTGLIYPPCCYADTEELISLGRVLAEVSRPLVVHMRSESDRILDALDEMIRVARARSEQFKNLEYRCADVMAVDLPRESFDCVATIATLHHLPLRETLCKLKDSVKPGGLLLVIDLFEPAGFRDQLLNVAAIGISGSLRLVHNKRLKPPKEVRAAWEAHGKTDSYPRMQELRTLCAAILPGAQIRQHLLWRYSIVWQKQLA